MLPKETERLVEAAKAAMNNAVAPYSGFRVGASLLAADGKIFTGCNVENFSLMLSMCAERVALLKALSEGARDFRAIAVVCEAGQPCYPCGSCRQMLSEFAPEIEVVLPSEKGIEVMGIKELLPRPFEKT